MNPPDHAALRRLVSRAFTPARVKALTPHIETITRELLVDGIDGEAGCGLQRLRLDGARKQLRRA